MMKVLAGTALAGFGSIAYTYLGASFLGDCIDYVEWKSGVRCDGFTSAIYGVLLMLSAGIAQGVFNFGLGVSGYVQPVPTGEIIDGVIQYENQTASAVTWINFAYQGGFIIIGFVLLLIFLAFNLERELPKAEEELQERKRAEYAARGMVYVSPQELEQREIEKQRREMEEIRIRELKEKCAKKGLDFEKENQKILDKRAAKERKKEKKKTKKNV